MSNFTGPLQEYCQKNKFGIPTYEVVKLGGPAHMPTFKAYVRFENGNGECCYEGKSSTSSKSAKHNAASMALDMVGEKPKINIKLDNKCEEQKQISNTNQNKDIYLLVDMENLPKFMTEIDKLSKTKSDITNNITINGFTSNNHPLSIKYKNDPRVHVIESIAPNACDTGIIMYVAGIIIKNRPKRIIIATADKNFGIGLIDCIIGGFVEKCLGMEVCDNRIKALLVSSVSQLEYIINKYVENNKLSIESTIILMLSNKSINCTELISALEKKFDKYSVYNTINKLIDIKIIEKTYNMGKCEYNLCPV